MKASIFIMNRENERTIKEAFLTAKEYAFDLDSEIHFVFNGARLIVTKDTTEKTIMDCFNMQIRCKAEE